ncbi:hypothetical protein D4A81_09110 [Lachnoanaerobaculum umeaense]|uniref:Uncharacterized protein n=1 Tax=Lachnoanaerobaculum umeaense TaxID=617123 RepID=A0A385Q1J6_9FIRM|nr:hypothetical protein D4A81_09110 [Lachnoanaerobaculum umeaense]PZW97400.1 hypothetical protein C7439_10914 [Lachnoanaerobaculum umeaense]
MDDRFFESWNQEMKDDIMYSALDESIKIIEYLEETNQKQHKYNIAILVFTIISSLCGIISVVSLFFK